MIFKTRFQENADFSKKHADAVSSEWFQEAVRCALLECSQQASEETDPVIGHYASKGAFRFVRVFNELSRPTVIPTRKDLDNLNLH